MLLKWWAGRKCDTDIHNVIQLYISQLIHGSLYYKNSAGNRINIDESSMNGSLGPKGKGIVGAVWINF